MRKLRGLGTAHDRFVTIKNEAQQGGGDYKAEMLDQQRTMLSTIRAG